MPNSRLLLSRRLLLAFLALASGVSGECVAEEIRLSWDAVYDERVAVYQVHFGNSPGAYTNLVNTSETSVVISQLEWGQAYFFAVRACEAGGINCSRFSNEVGTRIPRTDFIGVYHPSASGGAFLLDVSGNDSWDDGDWASGGFGDTDALPVAGDWNGDGFDEIGVYYPSSGWWYLDNNDDGIWTNGTDVASAFGGGTGFLPIAGDWNYDGSDEIGVYDPNSGWWYLDNNGDGIWTDGADLAFYFGGGTGTLPVAGDWNGDGSDEIGVYYPAAGLWVFDGDGNGVWTGAADFAIYFGGGTDTLPVAGDWNGDGFDETGVYYPTAGWWYLDSNGNGYWDSGGDTSALFGSAGDRPATGHWAP